MAILKRPENSALELVMTDATDKIIDAIIDEGRSPSYHKKKLRQLRCEWPLLARAIEALLIENNYSVPQELKRGI